MMPAYTKHSRWVPFSLAAAWWCAGPSLAIDFEKYEAVHEAKIPLFAAGLTKFGNHLRAAAVLNACGQEGIAKSVTPRAMDHWTFVLDEVKRMRDRGGKDAERLRGFTDGEMVSVL